MEGDINAKGINLKFMHVFRCAPQHHAMSIKMVISILGHAWAPLFSGCLEWGFNACANFFECAFKKFQCSPPSCDLPFAATWEMLLLTTSLFYLWAAAGSDNFQL